MGLAPEMIGPPDMGMGGGDVGLEPEMPPMEEEVVTPVERVPSEMMFEDFFPELNLSSEQEEGVATWLIRDLTTCVKHVNQMRNTWAMYRAIFMLEYVEVFYPDMGLGADFASGVLCEKVLEAIDRLRLSIFSPRPLFVVDDRVSNMAKIEVIHRLEWFLHTVLTRDLEIEDVIGMNGLFDYILDGSFILEADQMYESVPQKTIRTYASAEALSNDRDRIINQADYDEALENLIAGEKMQRVLIEEDTLTKNGLQFFRVNKEDHLIPPNVYDDKDIKFRGRRMYLTEADLKLMSKDDKWYSRKKVNEVLESRVENRDKHKNPEEVNAEEVSQRRVEELIYDWRTEEDRLTADENVTPYENTFAVYQVLCKYAYKTPKDPKGLVPKYCVFDIEPESRKLLRSVTYPHFHERPNYFHFKLGHAPKQYWGFGFGARLANEDKLESNAVNLYLNSAALATYSPFVCVHPDEGGRVPFSDGLGPAKVGYVRNVGEFQRLELPPPPPALIQALLPIVSVRAENRTSITSLTQGRTESSDPRSPASKTAMLIREANIGINSLIKDWNRAWNAVARFVWNAEYEKAVYEGQDKINDKIIFPGLGGDLEGTNEVTLDELRMDIWWQSQAASDFLNTELREEEFLKHFQFFAPQLQMLAQFAPEIFKKYFMRWMKVAGQELNIRNFKYLIPSEEEMGEIPPEQLMATANSMFGQLQDGQSQTEGLNMQQSGGR
jgi:hypothetical protein